jgi:hypothetical protein
MKVKCVWGTTVTSERLLSPSLQALGASFCSVSRSSVIMENFHKKKYGEGRSMLFSLECPAVFGSLASVKGTSYVQ